MKVALVFLSVLGVALSKSVPYYGSIGAHTKDTSIDGNPTTGYGSTAPKSSGIQKNSNNYPRFSQDSLSGNDFQFPKNVGLATNTGLAASKVGLSHSGNVAAGYNGVQANVALPSFNGIPKSAGEAGSYNGLPTDAGLAPTFSGFPKDAQIAPDFNGFPKADISGFPKSVGVLPSFGGLPNSPAINSNFNQIQKDTGLSPFVGFPKDSGIDSTFGGYPSRLPQNSYVPNSNTQTSGVDVPTASIKAYPDDPLLGNNKGAYGRGGDFGFNQQDADVFGSAGNFGDIENIRKSLNLGKLGDFNNYDSGLSSVGHTGGVQFPKTDSVGQPAGVQFPNLGSAGHAGGVQFPNLGSAGHSGGVQYPNIGSTGHAGGVQFPNLGSGSSSYSMTISKPSENKHNRNMQVTRTGTNYQMRYTSNQ